jgi:hypothetical protein
MENVANRVHLIEIVANMLPGRTNFSLHLKTASVVIMSPKSSFRHSNTT